MPDATQPSRLLQFPLSLFVLLATAGPVHAGTCAVTSSGLAFGTYQPLTFEAKLTSADVTSNASVSVVCTDITAGGSYTVALGPSTVGAGDRITVRYLANSTGGDPMAFNLFTSPTYTTVWGDGNTGSLIGESIPLGNSNQSLTVYGKIPAGQHRLQAGSFQDSMTMTLTYNP
jgi:spore coat protein U-like protein